MANYFTPAQTETRLREIVRAVRGIMDGKINSTGSFTITANQATTTITDYRVGANSVIHYEAITANAALEKANGTCYISNRGKNTFTVTHANNAQTDRDFIYSVIG